MARLGSYQQDAQVDGQDKLIGTSSSGGQTSSYSIDSVGDYMAKNNIIKVAGQINFKFVNGASDVGNGTFFVNGFGSDGVDMDTVTSIAVCKTNGQNQDVEKLIRKIFSDKVIITSVSDQNSFCEYSVNSITNTQGYDGFLTISLSNAIGDGVFNDEEYFSLSISGGSGDKTYVHSQEVNSATWNINHGLGKNPSVTVVNSSDVKVIAEVEYVDTNNLTIKFVNSTSGKAYLN